MLRRSLGVYRVAAIRLQRIGGRVHSVLAAPRRSEWRLMSQRVRGAIQLRQVQLIIGLHSWRLRRRKVQILTSASMMRGRLAHTPRNQLPRNCIHTHLHLRKARQPSPATARREAAHKWVSGFSSHGFSAQPRGMKIIPEIVCWPEKKGISARAFGQFAGMQHVGFGEIYVNIHPYESCFVG